MSTIKWNGRNAEDAVSKAVVPQVRDNVEKALRGARCAIHGETPSRVEVSGRDLGSLQWRVSGCCEEGLTAAAKRALS